jgi:hypothetical protein
MENSSRIEVQSGSYYTYDSQGSSAILSGAIYGTNTDPTTFDATDESNWDYVCDLAIISETPDPPPDPVMRIEATGGSWQGDYEYYFIEQTSDNRYLYGMVQKGETVRLNGRTRYDFKYDRSDGKFYDAGDSSPALWSADNTGTNLSAFPTAANIQTLYWYEGGDVLTFQFENPYYVAPSYRYLAFYGEPLTSMAIFEELELTLGTPLNGSSEIKYGVNDNGITFHESKAWTYYVDEDRYLTIMNGIKGWGNPNDPNKLRFDDISNTNAIFWYMDLGTGVVADVNGGTFWTYNDDEYAFALGKLYGTNTDPATFADASLIENYEFVCDLTKQTAS